MKAAIPLTLILVSLLGTGCSVFLPKHSRSLDRDHQKVEALMLNDAEYGLLCTELGIKPLGSAGKLEIDYARTPAVSGLTSELSGLAGVLVGAGIDYVQKKLEQEAELYEAQFVATGAFDEFWGKPAEAALKVGGKAVVTDNADPVMRITWKQNYRALVLRRWTEEHPKPDPGDLKEGDARIQPAFELVCELYPSVGQQAFRIRPVYLKVNSTRTKILDCRGWAFLWAWAFDTADAVDLPVNIQLDAIWRDAKQQSRNEKIANFTFSVDDYDLDGDDAGETKALKSGQIGQQGGWFLGVPPSSDAGGTLVGRGTFVATITVTERDPSNAKEYLEKGAKALGENKDKIVKAAQDALK